MSRIPAWIVTRRAATTAAIAFLALVPFGAIAATPRSSASPRAPSAAAAADSMCAPQVPRTMSYQGVLTDAAGNFVPDGLHNFTFRIYKSSTPGGPLWEESHAGVPVTRGNFNVILGASTSSPNPLDLPFDAPYDLGIIVDGGTELLPRVRLTAVPYSLRAASVENCSITAAGIAGKQVVKTLNGLTDGLTLAAGQNVNITPSGQTLIISSAGVGDSTFGRGRSWYDVTAYGARGDGITDDTAAIQAAITAAEADGSYEVQFPRGTYNVSSTLSCKRETWLVGLGDATIQWTPATGTCVKFASPSNGRYRGGGARNLTFLGPGGASTSCGASIGDGSNPSAWAQRVSLIDCEILHFGTGVVIDGPGSLSTGENSATDGFVLQRCHFVENVHQGMLVKTTFAIEISTIDQCMFMGNGEGQADGCAIALSSSGGGGGTSASAAVNLSVFASTFNENGNGTLAQIYCPASAWMNLKMNGCSFEGDHIGKTHIAALSNGSAIYDGPSSSVQLNNCYLQGYPISGRKESIVIGAGQLTVIGCSLDQDFDSVRGIIKAGAAGQFTGVMLLGNSFHATGTLANARVLEMVPGVGSFAALGNTYHQFGNAPSLVINPQGCLGMGDLLETTSDYETAPGIVLRNSQIVLSNDMNTKIPIVASGGPGKVLTQGVSLELYADTAGFAGFKVPIVLTANLPAPGPAQDGKLFIEDSGTGDRNIVLYAGGQRFRVDGRQAF
jgi:hypothetical protein